MSTRHPKPPSQPPAKPTARTNPQIEPGASFQFGRTSILVPRAPHLAHEPWDRGVTRIARHVDNALVSAGVVEAISDQFMHALPAHIGEVHWRAGWVVGVHLINSKGPVECPKSVKQQESCDDAECKDHGSERVLGVAGHDRSLAHQARSAPCQAQPIINNAGATWRRTELP